jgi:hypothetical protein
MRKNLKAILFVATTLGLVTYPHAVRGETLTPYYLDSSFQTNCSTYLQSAPDGNGVMQNYANIYAAGGANGNVISSPNYSPQITVSNSTLWKNSAALAGQACVPFGNGLTYYGQTGAGAYSAQMFNHYANEWGVSTPGSNGWAIVNNVSPHPAWVKNLGSWTNGYFDHYLMTNAAMTPTGPNGAEVCTGSEVNFSTETEYGTYYWAWMD